MNTEPDTPDIAPTPPPDSLRFNIQEMGKKDSCWQLEIRPDDLALFEGDDPQPYVILRERLLSDVLLLEGMHALALNKPRKLTLNLTPEATTAVAKWIGEPALAAFYLKRRYLWVLPLAIIWIIGALPMPGDADAGIEAKPLDLMGLGLGAALLVSWAFAKWRPHPALFLVDSIWFLWLAGYLLLDVVHGRSLLWLVLVAMLLWLVVKGLRHFVRFRGTHIESLAA